MCYTKIAERFVRRDRKILTNPIIVRMLRSSVPNNSRIVNNFVWHSLRFYASKKGNNTDEVEEWLRTLNEIDGRKVRYFRNEMQLNRLQKLDGPDPESLSVKDFKKLLMLSNNQRKGYYRYLNRNQFQGNDNKSYRKIEAEIFEQDLTRHYEPKVSVNKILPRFGNQTINRWKHKRLFHQMILDQQELIFDCGFENEMTSREVDQTAKELAQSFHRIRSHSTPFIMHLYNLNPTGSLRQSLGRQIQMLGCSSIPIRLSASDYINAYTKEKCILLTNESDTVLQQFEADRHYVLSGCVKLSHQNRFLHNKAKQNDLQTARIPFDLYCKFRASKILPLDHLTQILLEYKRDSNWSKAFEFVKRHKLK